MEDTFKSAVTCCTSEGP